MQKKQGHEFDHYKRSEKVDLRKNVLFIKKTETLILQLIAKVLFKKQDSHKNGYQNRSKNLLLNGTNG